jgi:hypothetical protein
MLLSWVYRKWLRSKAKINLAVGENTIIVSRSMNDKLFKMSQSLIALPYKRFKIINTRTSQRGASDYLHLLFEYPVKWLINIDEDCFVFNNNAIIGLLKHMQENKIDYCGIPDGGTCLHRAHNPVIMNPFFNIFNIENIRSKIQKESIKNINGCKFTSEMMGYVPEEILKKNYKFEFDNFEHFYGLFFWLLLKNFKPLYLPSYELEDKITTTLCDQNNIPFLYHTWYSRRYLTDTIHKNRIDFFYTQSKKISNIL